MLPRLLGRLVLAGASGLLLAAAFEPVAVAYVMPFSLAGFALATRGVRARRGFLLGLVFGAGFYYLHIEWMRSSVGLAPWVCLAGGVSLYFGVLGAVAAVLHRFRTWPAWLAIAWVAVEVVRSTWPFGGMPWGRLGFGVVDTPVAPLLAYAGVNGVSLLVALSGFLLARLVIAAAGHERRLAAVGLLVAVVTLVVPSLAPYHLDAGPDVTVAAVQGNVPGRGDDVADNYREVTANMAGGTQQLARDIAAGRRPRPAFVVWPENSTAIDPFLDASTNAEITQAVSQVGVPVLVGAVVDGGPDHVLNQGIVWDPVTGAGDRYTKWHPVPYGEYIPFRKYLSRVSLRLDEVPRDMVSGNRRTPLEIGGVRVADAICFDIAYDDGLGAQIENGADLVTVQTSNASFIYTDQVEQQFAITRARAIETGKYIVVASINGISGVIAPDGSVLAETAPRTAALIDQTVTLESGVTPGLRVGALIGSSTPWLLLAALIWALRTRRRHTTPGDETDAAGEPPQGGDTTGGNESEPNEPHEVAAR